MGMFDYVKLEDQVALPIPEDFKLDIKELEFQTKSLDKIMSLYTIGNDKHLYSEDSFSEEPRRELIDFHGTIIFYAYHQTDLLDYILDYKAKFTDGLLDKIDLVNYEVIEHESSKLKREKMMEDIKKENNKFSRKIFFCLSNLVVYPFRILGIKFTTFSPGILRSPDYVLSFHKPEIILGYKKDSFKRKVYGFSLDKVTTQICFSSGTVSKEFSFKILGFGFVFSKIKPFAFDSYS